MLVAVDGAEEVVAHLLDLDADAGEGAFLEGRHADHTVGDVAILAAHTFAEVEGVADHEAADAAAVELFLIEVEAGGGVQAATMMAMRSAYDNAEESAAELEAAISRKRQSEVTASVIETSGGNSFQ